MGNLLLALGLAGLAFCSFMLGVSVTEDGCPTVFEQLTHGVQPYIVDINDVWDKVEGWADAR